MGRNRKWILAGAVVLALGAGGLLIGGCAAAGTEPAGETVTINGVTRLRSELSEETLRWADMYLSLPEESQLALNYIPIEFRPRGEERPTAVETNADVLDVPESEPEPSEPAFDLSGLEESAVALDAPEGLAMTVVSQSGTEIEVEIQNNGEKEVTYGSPYFLEYCWQDSWYEVPSVLDSWAFTSIAYVVRPESSARWEEDFEWIYGTLPPGQYRIVKDVLVDREDTSQYDRYELAAEFAISQ